MALIAAMQRLAAEAAGAGVEAMLSEQGIVAPAVAQPQPRALSGVASDGRPLETLVALFLAPETPAYQFDRMVVTQIQDAGRSGAALGIATRPAVTKYVRMLVLPSCRNCVVLAGRIYRHSEAFERHPGCDCRHIPTVESVAGDLTTDPRTYFDSLTTAEQNRIFTKADAEAIRLGSDISQVVNAHRGMQTAQVFGRHARITTEGTTRRGSAYRAIKANHGAAQDVKLAGQRYSRTSIARPMPETLIKHATSREDAIRLLRIYGYIL